jgi:hypothetical protein
MEGGCLLSPRDGGGRVLFLWEMESYLPVMTYLTIFGEGGIGETW